MRLLSILILLLNVTSCMTTQNSDIRNQAGIVLEKQINGDKTPGLQYIIFTSDSIIYKFRGGFADIGKKIQVSDNTTYSAFSTTKTFTALAILQLSEQGKFQIDEPVKEYLQSFPYSGDITIRQLLTHSAGIPNPLPLKWIHLEDDHQSFDRNSFFSGIFNKHNRTKSNPNEKFSYSNLGYVLLGQLIESVNGVPYEEYIRENIIRPLNLKHDQLDFNINNPGQHAIGYQKRLSFINAVSGFLFDKPKFMGKSEGKWKPFKLNYVNGPSYGGLIGTPDSFVKYIQELLKPNCTLIADNNKKLMFTENYTDNQQATGMCLSWFKGQLKGNQYFAHAGGGGGYYCEIRIYPELKTGSVIMTNTTGISDQRILDKIDRYFITEKYK